MGRSPRCSPRASFSPEEKTLRRRIVFSGRILTLELLQVELASGVRSRREIIRHPGAVVVLARLPDGRFVLVRQFRKALERVLVEAVAGTLEPGERPASAARRELLEETGYRATRLVRLGRLAAAPGYCDEELYAYYADLDQMPQTPATDADEATQVVRLSPAAFEHAIRSGRICDAKTLAVSLLWRMRQGERERWCAKRKTP